MDGSHKCIKCKRLVHPFHGHPLTDEKGNEIEGHGASVTCFNCHSQDEKNLKSK